ncbi:MAG: hypothetical protein GWP70_08950 [Proteobacteria bacterium]|nr:hypothetical protein [Pseudomonadota bacterium]
MLALPQPTSNAEQACSDLHHNGCCIWTDVLKKHELHLLRDKFEQQYEAEQSLGELLPDRGVSNKIVIPNLVNKGQHYLDFVTRKETNTLATFALGKSWLLSSLTAHLFVGTTERVELVHRDQGQVPASLEQPALLNLFYLLDDFTPERGSTVVFPGSHRWPLQHRIEPPSAEDGLQITAPAGSLFAFEGRLWHATGINHLGHRRRALSVFCSVPWLRQQENALAATSHDVLENASPQLRARLGLRTYGTLGNVNGTKVPEQRVAFGNVDVALPDYLIGENAELIPLTKVRSRASK